MHIDIHQEVTLQLNDPRICQYIWHMLSVNKEVDDIEEPSNLELYKFNILEKLDINLLQSMILEFKNISLSKDELSCIDPSNERLLRFIWGSCKDICMLDNNHLTTRTKHSKLISVKGKPIPKIVQNNLMDSIIPNNNPLSKKSIYNEIIKFFDLTILSKSSQKRLLRDIFTAWNLASKLDFFDWLDPKNKKQMEWLEDYIDKKKIIDKETQISAPTNDQEKKTIQKIYHYPQKKLAEPNKELVIAKTSRQSDQMFYCLSLIDLWDISNDVKNKFLFDLKKAWKMKVTRDIAKQDQTKSMITLLSKPAAKALRKIAKKQAKTAKLVIEELIEMEYQRKNY